MNAFQSGPIATLLMGAAILVPYCCSRLQRVSGDRPGTYQAQRTAHAATLLARVSGFLAPPSFLIGTDGSRLPAERQPHRHWLPLWRFVCCSFSRCSGSHFRRQERSAVSAGNSHRSMLLIAALFLSQVWLNSDLLPLTASLRNPGHSRAHSFASNFTMCSGFTRALSTVSPQCRCGPVTRPVAPTFPRAAPASKVSPTFASISERCP